MKKFTFLKNKKGFTMAETLGVVAIISILAAVSFLAVNALIKNTRQMKLDKTAETIYLATQNNLSDVYTFRDSSYQDLKNQSKALNVTDGSTPYTFDAFSDKSGVARDPVMDIATHDLVYAFASTSDEDAKSANVKAVFPAGIVSDEIYDGTWIVEYSPSTFMVQSVFYSEEENATQFYNADNATNIRTSRENRISYGATVGYYEGNDAEKSTPGRGNMRVRIKMINAEKLIARLQLSVPSKDVDGNDVHVSGDGAETVSYEVQVSGKRSDHAVKQTVTIGGGATSFSTLKDEDGNDYYLYEEDIELDSLEKPFAATYGKVTSSHVGFEIADGQGHHTANTYGTPSCVDGHEGALIPGENVSVDIKATSTGTANLKSVKSSATANSLFASASIVGAEGGNNYVAKIKYARHLQNLDSSYFNKFDENWKHKVKPSDKIALNIVAEQTANIDFTSGEPGKNDETYKKYSSVYGHKTDGGAETVRTFIPIYNEDFKEYNGNEKKIIGINANVRNPINRKGDPITTSGSFESGKRITENNIKGVGLFATFSGDTLKDIIIEDGKFTGSDKTDSTGALAGIIPDLTYSRDVEISGCSVYMDKEASGANLDGVKDVWLAGGKYAGGLVGVSGENIKLSIEESSAASVITTSTTDNSYAGGLVAYVKGKASINKSYADSYIGNKNLAAEKTATVGGLVGGLSTGAANTFSIKNSYAAGMVINPEMVSTAAGFVVSDAKTLDNSYTVFAMTGVPDDHVYDAVTGLIEDGGKATNVYYNYNNGKALSDEIEGIIHAELQDIVLANVIDTDETEAKVKLDTDVFAVGVGNASNTIPYNLDGGERSTYPYPMLRKDSAIVDHHGDWANIEESYNVKFVYGQANEVGEDGNSKITRAVIKVNDEGVPYLDVEYVEYNPGDPFEEDNEVFANQVVEYGSAAQIPQMNRLDYFGRETMILTWRYEYEGQVYRYVPGEDETCDNFTGTIYIDSEYENKLVNTEAELEPVASFDSDRSIFVTPSGSVYRFPFGSVTADMTAEAVFVDAGALQYVNMTYMVYDADGNLKNNIPVGFTVAQIKKQNGRETYSITVPEKENLGGCKLSGWYDREPDDKDAELLEVDEDNEINIPALQGEESLPGTIYAKYQELKEKQISIQFCLFNGSEANNIGSTISMPYYYFVTEESPATLEIELPDIEGYTIYDEDGVDNFIRTDSSGNIITDEQANLDIDGKKLTLYEGNVDSTYYILYNGPENQKYEVVATYKDSKIADSGEPIYYDDGVTQVKDSDGNPVFLQFSAGEDAVVTITEPTKTGAVGSSAISDYMLEPKGFDVANTGNTIIKYVKDGKHTATITYTRKSVALHFDLNGGLNTVQVGDAQEKRGYIDSTAVAFGTPINNEFTSDKVNVGRIGYTMNGWVFYKFVDGESNYTQNQPALEDINLDSLMPEYSLVAVAQWTPSPTGTRIEVYYQDANDSITAYDGGVAAYKLADFEDRGIQGYDYFEGGSTSSTYWTYNTGGWGTSDQTYTGTFYTRRGRWPNYTYTATNYNGSTNMPPANDNTTYYAAVEEWYGWPWNSYETNYYELTRHTNTTYTVKGLVAMFNAGENGTTLKNDLVNYLKAYKSEDEGVNSLTSVYDRIDGTEVNMNFELVADASRTNIAIDDVTGMLTAKVYFYRDTYTITFNAITGSGGGRKNYLTDKPGIKEVIDGRVPESGGAITTGGNGTNSYTFKIQGLYGSSFEPYAMLPNFETYDWNATDGKRMTYLDQFTADETYSYDGKENGNSTVKFYLEARTIDEATENIRVGGTTYYFAEPKVVKRGNGTFYFTEKFQGCKLSYYRDGSGGINEARVNGTSNSGNLSIYYLRNKYSMVFRRAYVKDQGTTEATVDNIMFEDVPDASQYSGSADKLLSASQLECPYGAGYEFAGWYLDSSYSPESQIGDAEGNITNQALYMMGDYNLELFAKWDPIAVNVNFVTEFYRLNSENEQELVTTGVNTETVEGRFGKSFADLAADGITTPAPVLPEGSYTLSEVDGTYQYTINYTGTDEAGNPTNESIVYAFMGWYRKSGDLYSNVFSENERVYNESTLYARWRQVSGNAPYTIRCIAEAEEGEEAPPAVEITKFGPINQEFYVYAPVGKFVGYYPLQSRKKVKFTGEPNEERVVTFIYGRGATWSYKVNASVEYQDVNNSNTVFKHTFKSYIIKTIAQQNQIIPPTIVGLKVKGDQNTIAVNPNLKDEDGNIIIDVTYVVEPREISFKAQKITDVPGINYSVPLFVVVNTVDIINSEDIQNIGNTNDVSSITGETFPIEATQKTYVDIMDSNGTVLKSKVEYGSEEYMKLFKAGEDSLEKGRYQAKGYLYIVDSAGIEYNVWQSDNIAFTIPDLESLEANTGE